MKIIIVLIASVLSAILYRLGGSAKNGDWWDFAKHSKTRDLGCTLVALLALYLIGLKVAWYWYIPTIIGMVAAFTTYWDDVFGYDNYMVHLAVVGAALLIFPIMLGCWYSYVIRIILMAGFGGASHLIDKTNIPHRDVVSELIRGFGVSATLILF